MQGNHGIYLLTTAIVAQLIFDEQERWDSVLLTYETRICLRHDSGRIRIWRVPDYATSASNPEEYYRQGARSIMFWTGIMHGLRTPCAHDRQYDCYDNAWSHRGRYVNEQIQATGITRMQWSAYSPGMNPIQHAWDQLKHAICRCKPPVQTLYELREAANQEWNHLDQQCLDNLIESMRRHIQTLVRTREGMT
ncbi:hypothetical protein ANN_17705, partial [Periplaneta americana]